MYKEIIFILHCFALSWCFLDPYVFRLTVCFSADPGCSTSTAASACQKGVISYLRICVGFFLTWWK